jgi:hypothetical protein
MLINEATSELFFKSQYQYFMNWIQTFHKRTELEAIMACCPFKASSNKIQILVMEQ